MKNPTKQVLSILLVFVLVLGMLPMPALAADSCTTHDYADGACTVCGQSETPGDSEPSGQSETPSESEPSGQSENTDDPETSNEPETTDEQKSTDEPETSDQQETSDEQKTTDDQKTTDEQKTTDDQKTTDGQETSDEQETSGEPEVDEAVEAVQNQIHALPSAEEYWAMDDDGQYAAYDQLAAAYEAFAALTGEQQGQVDTTAMYALQNAVMNGAQELDTVVEAKWGTSRENLPNEGTLEDALNQADDEGSTVAYIQLQTNITPEYGVFLKSKCASGLTFDLNEKTIIVPNGYAITVYSGAQITITGNGSVTAQGEGYSAIYCYAGAELVINNGSYTGANSAVLAYNSSDPSAIRCTINGGQFSGSTSAVTMGAILDDTVVDAEFTINGGTFHTNGQSAISISSGTVSINGGSFTAGSNGALEYHHGKVYFNTVPADNFTICSMGDTAASVVHSATGAANELILPTGWEVYNVDDPTNPVKVNQMVNGEICYYKVTGSYSITCEYDGNKGSVSANTDEPTADATITLTVTPQTGYVLDSITATDVAGGIALTQSATNTNQYTFTMPPRNVTVKAEFIHTHDWEYTANTTAKTITVVCNNGCGASGTATLTVPTDLVYDGTAKNNASVSTTNWPDGLEKPTAANITYTGDLTNVSTAGITAKLTWQEKSVEATYYVTQRPITDSSVAVSVTSSQLTYNKSSQSPTVTVTYNTNLTEGSDYTLSGDTSKSDAGDYKITIEGKGNYTGSVEEEWSIQKKVIGITWSNTELTYNDKAQAPTAKATGLLGSDTCDITVTGATDKVGTHTATAESVSNSNYQLPTDVTTSFTIKNAKDAPSVTGNAETISGKKDGTIEDLTTDMEWSTTEDGTYEKVTDPAKTFAPGTYYVRYQETETYWASKAAKVTIGEGRMLTVTLPTEQKGYTLTASKNKAAWEESVTLTFALKPGYSQVGGFAVKVNDTKYTTDGPYTIQMTNDVTVTVVGVADTEAPTAKIQLTASTLDSDPSWESIQNPVAFNTYVNAHGIEVSAADTAADGVTISYHASSEALSEDDVMALDEGKWTEYKEAFNLPDGKYVVYAKAVDGAGNETYVSTNGFVVDRNPPEIQGVAGGHTYYTTQVATVEDANLDTLTLNDQAVVNSRVITLTGNQEATYTIFAKDKATNQGTVTIYMKPISSLSGPIKDLTTDTVTPEHKETVEEVKTKVESILDKECGNATDEEVDELEDILEKCKELLEKIHQLGGGDVSDMVEKLPDPSKVNPDDKEVIDLYDQVKDAYDSLPEDYQELIPDTVKDKLDKVGAALTAYDITHQSAKYHAKGSGKTITFTANGYYAEYGSYVPNAYGKFFAIEVDDNGKAVDPKNYEVKAGSTVITLKASYLESLSVGKHTITVHYIDGSTDGKDTFHVYENNGIPFTGDSTNLMLLSGVALTSLLGMAMMLAFFPRKKGKYQR